MPIYEHKCEACDHVWEDLFKVSDPIPEECPKCAEQGKVIRLLSWCSGKVELTGQELCQQLKQDAKKIKGEALGNENKLANLMGEDKYHQIMSTPKAKKGK